MAFTCPSASTAASSAGVSGEIMLFGVRVVVDSMRKSVSMNNLSQYEQPPESSANQNRISSSSNNNGDEGYASADDAVPISSRNRGRKRGVPWTEEEHKLFLLGLQRVGKGDWRGISRNFVKTRTPTQVASHAQKYFLRRSNIHRRRRRSSVFDITTDTTQVPTIPNDERQRNQQENSVDEPQALPPPPAETKSSSVLPLLPVYPPAVNPAVLSAKADNPREGLMLGQGRQSRNATMSRASPVFNLGLSSGTANDSSSLSLKLSLSMDQTELSSRHPALREIPSFSNRDSGRVIGVA